MQKKSVDDILKFLTFMAKKGFMKTSTASSRKVAINKVFSVLDEKERGDIFALDIDSIVERFHNKNGMDVSPNTLRIYKSRIRSSIADFERYQENPTSFKPAIHSRTLPHKPPPSAKTYTSNNLVSVSNNKDRQESSDETKFSIPIPLRKDVIIHISSVPHDLTEKEAQRVARVITAYARPSSQSS